MARFLFPFFLAIAFSARAQEVKLPQIIPPSPDAAAIGKFGDVQVSTYSGIPSIQIPLYEIKSRDISIPIGLSYHAAGIKVEEEASWVGLCWALNASFSVTRTVRGNDDLSTNQSRLGYPYCAMPDESTITTGPGLAQIELICSGVIDGLPDVFNFNFMGSNGKFYLKKKVSASDPLRILLDNNNEKISITYDEGTQTWTIINKEGYKGVFSIKEYSRSLSGSVPNPQVGIPAATSWDQSPLVPDIITTWHIDDITSPTGEVVDFVYGNSPYSSISTPSLSDHANFLTAVVSNASVNNYLFGIPIQTQNLGTNTFPGSGNSISYSASYQVSFPKYLSEIYFSNGKVKFITSQRDDMQEYTGSKPQKLDRIEVRNTNDDLVKAFDFDYLYYNSDAIANTYQLKRLKLNKVTESNGGAIAKKPYRFSYEGDLPSGNNPLPPKNSAARDHWGYYNGKLQNNTVRNGNPSLIPEFNLSSLDGLIHNIKGADRNSDEASTKGGVLNKITYPTGGTTEFQYELKGISKNPC